MATSIIGHLDADCFYVSCERVRFPGLKGKPVGVLGNQGACIIAKSYELKAKGVKTGWPIWDAHKLCPEAIYVKRDFYWYEELSRQLVEMVRQASPTVEYYSVDELFFDAGPLLKSRGREGISDLQKEILKETGIPVSIGISLSKLLAKLASDSAKPFGIDVAVTEDEIQALLKGKPVGDVTGIARQRRKTLNSRGIFTCDQFVKADRRLIRKLITKNGEDMWWELRGVSVLPIATSRPPHKVVARGGSVGAATADRLRIEAWIIRNIERLTDALEHHGYVCDKLGLMLGYKDGTGSYGTAVLLGPTAYFEHLAPIARELFETGYKTGKKVHYMHLIAERIQFKKDAQTSIFQKEPEKSLTGTANFVNRHTGRFSVRSAATLPLTDIYRDDANEYDICDIYGKTCF